MDALLYCLSVPQPGGVRLCADPEIGRLLLRVLGSEAVASMELGHMRSDADCRLVGGWADCAYSSACRLYDLVREQPQDLVLPGSHGAYIAILIRVRRIKHRWKAGKGIPDGMWEFPLLGPRVECAWATAEGLETLRDWHALPPETFVGHRAPPDLRGQCHEYCAASKRRLAELYSRYPREGMRASEALAVSRIDGCLLLLNLALAHRLDRLVTYWMMLVRAFETAPEPQANPSVRTKHFTRGVTKRFKRAVPRQRDVKMFTALRRRRADLCLMASEAGGDFAAGRTGEGVFGLEVIGYVSGCPV